ncbi:hypothetical protein HRbin39_01794 [bacterium HR39]|nr:hypothetical protein HRbin39_01794 [bacterium HR39]
MLLDLDPHLHPVALFEPAQHVALAVEEVEGDVGGHPHGQRRRLALEALVLDAPQHVQRQALGRAHETRAGAVRTDLGGELEDARPQPLARKLEQAEARDAAHLDARPVGLEGLAQPPLHLPLVARIVHVDEVHHHEPGDVAQPELAGDFLRRLEVGLEGRLVDVPLAGGLARVDVDGGERLGGVDDDGTARWQLHHRAHHGVELVLDAVAGEEGHLAGVLLHQPHPARAHDLHHLARPPPGLLALDQDLLDVTGVEVAQRPGDEVALLVDQARRDAGEHLLADVVPQAHQILVVAPDLRLGALLAGGADDEPHALRHAELLGDLLEPPALGGIGDLARNAAALRRVGHQHAVAARQGDVGGERRALGAALLLDHLHQHDLPAPDHLLDAVGAQDPGPPPADLLEDVGGLLLRVLGDGGAVGVLLGLALGVGAGLELPLQPLQLLPVGLRDLVVVGMDLAEGQEAVPIAAVVDEGGLQRRFDPDDLGEIDVTLELTAAGDLDVEVDQSAVLADGHPRLFRVGGVDEHALGHRDGTPAAGRAAPSGALAHHGRSIRVDGTECDPIRSAGTRQRPLHRFLRWGIRAGSRRRSLRRRADGGGRTAGAVRAPSPAAGRPLSHRARIGYLGARPAAAPARRPSRERSERDV